MCSPTRRAIISVVPPAANGTINTILRSGNAATAGGLPIDTAAMSETTLTANGLGKNVFSHRTLHHMTQSLVLDRCA